MLAACQHVRPLGDGHGGSQVVYPDRGPTQYSQSAVPLRADPNSPPPGVSSVSRDPGAATRVSRGSIGTPLSITRPVAPGSPPRIPGAAVRRRCADIGATISDALLSAAHNVVSFPLGTPTMKRPDRPQLAHRSAYSTSLSCVYHSVKPASYRLQRRHRNRVR